MPLSKTSNKVLKKMQDQYGAKKGKQVFYATASKKTGKAGRGTAEKASTWKTSKEDIERIAAELSEEFISEMTFKKDLGIEPKYCTKCQMTTDHKKDPKGAPVCLQCGAEKQITHPARPTAI